MCDKPLWSIADKHTYMSGSASENSSLVLALFIAPDYMTASSADNNKTSFLERTFLFIVDTAIHFAQPEPRLKHVELMLVDQNGGVCFFNTYLGDIARVRPYDDLYYSTRNWRAVPVDLDNSERLLRAFAYKERDAKTPYSILRYFLAIPLGGLFAPLVNDSVGTGAQCAALSARAIKKSLITGRLVLPWSGPRYSPSLLYNHLLANSHTISGRPNRCGGRAVSDTASSVSALTHLKDSLESWCSSCRAQDRAAQLKHFAANMDLKSLPEQRLLATIALRCANAAAQYP